MVTLKPLTQPYDTFLNGTNGYNDQTGVWKNNVTFEGYTWYRYTTLLEINNTLGITSNAIEKKHVFYNQENNSLALKNFKSYNQVTIYNTNGSLISTFNSKEKLQLSSITTGVYVVRVNTKSDIYSQKIIIR